MKLVFKKQLVATVLSSYIGIWIFIYLLIHRVMNEEGRKVLGAPCIIMAVEIVKCIISFILFCRTQTATCTSDSGASNKTCHSFVQGFKDLTSFCKSQTCSTMLMLYAPVALLYAVYNNLMLVNLKSHHPTVYLILSTSRVLMVAYTWQIVFKVKISQTKKMALIAIVLGIVAKGIFADQGGGEASTLTTSSIFETVREMKSVLLGSFLVVCQMACSVIASVYNEKLLKHNDCDQQLQNICLYIDSIVINAIFFAATRLMSMESDSSSISAPTSNSSDAESAIFSPSMALVVFALASSGIITSLVLRYVNSLTKSVASATETIFTYLIEISFFQYGIDCFEALSVLLVTAGAIMYAADQSEKNSSKQQHASAGSKTYEYQQNLAIGNINDGDNLKNFSIRRRHRNSRGGVILRMILFLPLFMLITMSLMISRSSILQKSEEFEDIFLRATKVRQNGGPNELCVEKDAYQIHKDNYLFKEQNPVKQKKVIQAQKILSYIVEQLSAIGAPATMMFGTMLHELRNGTGHCVIPRVDDKDFDIAVFERHFEVVANMKDDILQKFGWEVTRPHNPENPGAHFLFIHPPKQRVGKGFQIDVYGFKCDKMNQLIFFDWDRDALRMQDFLPLMPYKTVPVPDTDTDHLRKNQHLEEIPAFSMPYNVPCIAASLYGPNYMQPAEKGSYFLNKQGYVAANGYDACRNKDLSSIEMQERIRQQSFCQAEDLNVVATTAEFWRKWKKQIIRREKRRRKQRRGVRNLISTSAMVKEEKKHNIGIVACVNERADVAHAFALAQEVRGWNIDVDLNMTIEVEIYHYSQLSQYATAILEQSSSAISTVNIDIHSGARKKSCMRDALSVSSLQTILVEDLKDVGNIRNIMARAFNLNTLSPSHLGKCPTKDNIPLKQTFLVPSNSLMEDDVDHFLSEQTDKCVYQKVLVGSNLDVESATSIQRSLGTMPAGSLHSTRRLDNHYFNAHRFMLLDRPINWVAFDGGVPLQLSVPESSGDLGGNKITFNSLEGALKSAQQLPSGLDMMVNIDLVTTADGVHVGMHDAKSFGPYAFEGNHISGTSLVSSMTFDQIRSVLHNPCVPFEVIKAYLVSNKYYHDPQRAHTDDCSVPINRIEDFLKDTSAIPDLVLDLKSSNETYDQGLEIFKSMKAGNEIEQEKLGKLSMRYFSFDKKGIGRSSEVMPGYLFNRINNGNHPSDIKLFVNTPSIEACHVIDHWMRDKKVMLTGCFVQLNNAHTRESWNYYSKQINVPTAIVSKRMHQSLKIICDVPRPQNTPETAIWNDGLIQCIENGYEWIHYPFSPFDADHSSPQSPKVIQTITNEKSVEMALQDEKSRYGKLQEFSTYKSQWGVTSPFYWKSIDQQWEFNGHNIVSQRPLSQMSSSLSIFRCVSKILTVMIYLKLEELGLLRIDDQVEGSLLDSGSSVTWRQIFTNTAGIDGSNAGKEFMYSNSMWVHVEAFVEKVTGMSFKKAIEFYIVNPMGLSGHFDDGTEYPPFTARGFVGTNEDLMIIGGTLASNGVSPKTRKQIIQPNTAKTMLKDWTKLQNVTKSFLQDKTVESMNRFRHEESEFKYSIVDGYGMGLWCVKGWRTNKSTGEPIVGWLAMGSSEALLYFDTDAIVVSMAAQQRVKGLELTTAFAKVVRSM